MSGKRQNAGLFSLILCLIVSACGSEGTQEPIDPIVPTSTSIPETASTIAPTPMGGGETIIFVSNREVGTRLYSLDTNTLKVDPLSIMPGWSSFDDYLHDGEPALSPDGKTIVFSSLRDEPDLDNCALSCNYDIYSVDENASSVIRLTDDPGWDRQPAWSPDGKQIAFTSTRVRGVDNIFVMDRNGSNITLLTDTNGSTAPVWSPDGKYIAYVTFIGDLGIYVMNADGSDSRKLTGLPSGITVPWKISWSPDGKHIAFVSDVEGLGIYMMNADGTNVTRIIDNTTWLGYPAWSPDSKSIAFVSNRDNPGIWDSLDVYKVNMDGSNLNRLTNNPANYKGLIWVPMLTNEPLPNSTEQRPEPIETKTPSTLVIEGNALFSEDFSSNEKGWSVGSEDLINGVITREIANGRYLMRMKSSKPFCFSVTNVPIFTGNNFSFSIDATIIKSPVSTGQMTLGFSLRGNDEQVGSHYLLTLMDDGTSYLDLWPTENFEDIVSLWSHPATNQFALAEGATNSIKIEMKGSKISAFFNGQKIDSVIDSTIGKAGTITFYLGLNEPDEFEIEFDNLEIKDVP